MSKSFKRAPSGTADYEIASDTSVYTFFSDNAAAKSKSLGSGFSTKLADFVVNKSERWSTVSPLDYDGKRETVKASSIKDLPSSIFGPKANISYWYYDHSYGHSLSSEDGFTHFAVYFDKKEDVFFSEALNYSDDRQEFNIFRNEDPTYVVRLFEFLSGNARPLVGSKIYDKIRLNVYNRFNF